MALTMYAKTNENVYENMWFQQTRSRLAVNWLHTKQKFLKPYWLTDDLIKSTKPQMSYLAQTKTNQHQIGYICSLVLIGSAETKCSYKIYLKMICPIWGQSVPLWAQICPPWDNECLTSCQCKTSRVSQIVTH